MRGNPTLLAVAVATALLACGYAPKGVVDERTGLTGVATSAGALAGDWATVATFQTVVTAGLLGDKPGGWRSHFLVHRAWTGAGYEDTWRRCLRDAQEVAGTRTLVPNGTYAKLQPIPGTASADHAAGAFSTADVVELWGVHNLPDPATTELPKEANFKTPPQSDWVFDEDEDGNPAVTELSHGTVSGSMFVVERTVFALEGTVVSKERLQGLVRLRSNGSNRLGATSGWLMGESVTRVDPSRLAWFDAARLKDGATCDDVAAAVAEGRVSTTQPF